MKLIICVFRGRRVGCCSDDTFLPTIPDSSPLRTCSYDDQDDEGGPCGVQRARREDHDEE